MCVVIAAQFRFGRVAVAARLQADQPNPEARPSPVDFSAPLPPSEADCAVPIAAAGLRLDVALALLRQAGQDVPAHAPGSAAYLQALIDQLVDMSSRDALTGLANRRSFELALGREVDRVARSGEPALLLMVDIDHFKRVNDSHGHAAGDLVIRAVAQALTDSIRPMDLVARIGGEEFAVLLPNCPAAFGPQVAARVRQRVARTAVALPSDGQTLAVTVSVGGAFAPQWVRSTPTIWLQRADNQLYRAKAEGRDRVCFEHSAAPEVSALEREMLLGGHPIQDSE
jgi:diguanylate cyclase (GGDEF)-like protein